MKGIKGIKGIEAFAFSSTSNRHYHLSFSKNKRCHQSTIHTGESQFIPTRSCQNRCRDRCKFMMVSKLNSLNFDRISSSTSTLSYSDIGKYYSQKYIIFQ